MNALAAYAHDQGRRGLRPATITTRRRILRSLDGWLAGSILESTPDQIELWLDSLNLSSRSRYTYLSAVASFFEFARRQRLTTVDPTEQVRRPKLPRLIPRPAAAEDVIYAMEQAEPRMRTWLALATFQGFRCMEIAQLRREDILEDRDPPLIVIADGKGGRQDVLTLNDHVELALRDHGLPRQGYVFTRGDGHPYKPASVSRYIGTFLRAVGVEATAHRLRHLYVSTVWAETHDLRVTQEAARHADPRTTAGYAAYDREAMSRVLRKLSLPRCTGPVIA